MSDSEEIKTDYLSETSEEEDVPTSEIDEEERIDEYIEAVERYAQLIREVPQEDLGGIVEMVEKVFEQHYEPDDNSDIIWGVLFSTGVILLASGLRLYFL
jgi:actin-like ATPase involved in cell morphogenesis